MVNGESFFQTARSGGQPQDATSLFQVSRSVGSLGAMFRPGAVNEMISGNYLVEQ